MRKVAVFVCILLLVVFVGASGYWIYLEMSKQDIEIQKIKNDLNSKSDELKKSKEELSKAKIDIENYKLLVTEYKAKEDERSDPYYEWKTYKDKELGIKFKYPESFKVVKDNSTGNIEVQSVLEDKYGSSELFRKGVVVFSKERFFYSYDNKTVKFSNGDPRKITIAGKDYPYSKYVMGEGSFGGFFYNTTYSAKYTNNLYLALIIHSEGNSTVDCTDSGMLELYGGLSNCNSQNEENPKSEFTLSKENQARAVLVMQSLELL